MRYRPIDKDPEDPRLGRFIPDDWAHVEKYPWTGRPRGPDTQAGCDRCQLVHGVRQAPGRGHSRRHQVRPSRCRLVDQGPRWALRLSRTRRRARSRGVVGLLRPGYRGRVCWLWMVTLHVAPKSGALRRALAVGSRQGDRPVARDQSRRQQRNVVPRGGDILKTTDTSTGVGVRGRRRHRARWLHAGRRQWHQAVSLGAVGRPRAQGARLRRRRRTSSTRGAATATPTGFGCPTMCSSA